MMEELLFLAPYPNESNIQDGYRQRIKNIDNLVADRKRTYLDISTRIIREKTIVENNLTIYVLNPLKSKNKIKKIINQFNKIYVHSIYNMEHVINYFNPTQEITLDFHGIVPEELKFCGKKIMSWRFNKIEKKAISRVNHIVVVTHSMKDFIIKKYNIDDNKFIFYPIVSKNVIKDGQKELAEKKENEIVFVYSGNCQKWQRIKDIVNFINHNDNENYTYYFLTLQRGVMDRIIKRNIIRNYKSKIIIKTVSPSELYKYYTIAAYGFLIRDDHPLNRVANPTKMLEYMYYGLNIIVDLIEIGDYRNYDLLKYNISNTITGKKSEKNREIALELLNEKTDDLRKVVFNQ